MYSARWHCYIGFKSTIREWITSHFLAEQRRKEIQRTKAHFGQGFREKKAKGGEVIAGLLFSSKIENKEKR